VRRLLLVLAMAAASCSAMNPNPNPTPTTVAGKHATTTTTRKAAPPTPTPTTTRSVYYIDCPAAWAADAAPILKGQPGYRPELDRDRDGTACEAVRS